MFHQGCSHRTINPLRINTSLILLLLVGLLPSFVSMWWPSILHAQNQSGVTSPSSNDNVSGDVIISGTAVIDPFLRYELFYKQEPNGDDAYIYFDGGTTQVVNGQLGIWRTNTLQPGTYSIRLRVVKLDGNYGEFVISNLKVNLGAVATETPTVTPTSSEPTSTPIPTWTFTPAPQPTPVVGQINRPLLEGDAPPTPEPVPIANVPSSPDQAQAGDAQGADANVAFEPAQSSANADVATGSFTRQLGEAVALERLRTYFVTGMRFSATLILGVVALIAGKRIFGWIWTQYR